MTNSNKDTVFEELSSCQFETCQDEIHLNCHRCPTFVAQIKKLRKEVQNLQSEHERLRVSLELEKKNKLRDLRDFEATLTINRAHFKQIKSQNNQLIKELLPKLSVLLSKLD